MLKKIFFISLAFLILVFLFFNYQKIFAYDDQTTHPALTEEIIDFYNLSFPNKQLTSQQKEWIIEGSILEDTPPRWINHFFDPINKTGWSGEYAGKYDAETVQLISEKLIAPYGITPVSSLNWLHNEQLQSQYGFYKGNKTWERGIFEMIKGNEKEAYQILGYIIHLIEDASVPDHTRNDTHAHELEEATGDYGSPYEEYLKKYTRQNIKKELNIANNLKKENLFPLQKSTIDEYMISLAEYSNKYFFSKDTINDQKYQNPKIVRDDGEFGYGIDENGKEFPLVKSRKVWDENKKEYKSIYEILDTEEIYYQILNAYFSRLSRQVVLNGAGVIDLFHKDIEFKKEYSPHLITYDFSIFNNFEIPQISLTGELVRLGNVVQSFFVQVGDAVSSVSGFFSSIFQDTDSNELSANLSRQISSNQQPVQYEGFQTLENQVNQTAQIIEQPSALANENQTAVASQTTERQQALAEIQAQLDLIKIQAEELANQEKQLQLAVSIPIQISYSGSGGGGDGGSGGGNPVIVEPAPSAVEVEAQNSSTENNSTSTINSTAIIDDSKATSTDIISTTTIAITAVNHILISEIYPDITTNNFDFVELYNPTDASVPLKDYSLKILKEETTSTSPLASFSASNVIAAKSFFLIGLDNYKQSTSTVADISRSSYSLTTTKTATVILYDNNNSVDEFNYNPVNLAVGQSFERKSFYNNQCATASSSNEFLGNGCDTDYVGDFSAEGGLASGWEIRNIPNPQNSSNLPEPRQAPTTPQNFQIAYNASSMKMKFSWQESQDYSSSTSTLIYKIIDLDSPASTYYVDSSNSVPTSTLQTALTSLSVFVDEVGRDYNFSIQAFDKEGLGSEIATATISVPSFLSSLYFYYESEPSFNDNWTPPSIKPVIEASYFQYPFVMDLSHFLNGEARENTSWKIMVFYLNSEAEKQPNIYSSISAPQNTWPQEILNKILKLQYNNCSIYSLNHDFLVLPDISASCNSIGGGMYGLAIAYNDVVEDNHFLIKVSGAGVNQSWPMPDLTENDYLAVAYYSFISSSVWAGGTDNFGLVAIDKTKYYFGKEPIHQSPTAPNNLTATPDSDYSNLIINWENSTDPDSMDNSIRYELNYVLAGQTLDENNWQETGIGPSIPINPDNSYDIYLRAKDEFGNIAISSIYWSSLPVLQ